MIFKEIFTWWHNQTIGTRVWTFFNGHRIGDDKFGNVYMQNKTDSHRWVIYKGEIDSTKVPPEWNGWLRYTSNEIPSLKKKHDWEKEHLQNQTGTANAYYPKLSIIKNPENKKKSEYGKWTPKN